MNFQIVQVPLNYTFSINAFADMIFNGASIHMNCAAASNSQGPVFILMIPILVMPKCLDGTSISNTKFCPLRRRHTATSLPLTGTNPLTMIVVSNDPNAESLINLCRVWSYLGGSWGACLVMLAVSHSIMAVVSQLHPLPLWYTIGVSNIVSTERLISL